jgi:hydroxymethylglutaryl-CoA synthase
MKVFRGFESLSLRHYIKTVYYKICAHVAEQVDAQDLKSCVRKDVPVRFWSWAPPYFFKNCTLKIYTKNLLTKTVFNKGILSWGAYVPRYRISTSEIHNYWNGVDSTQKPAIASSGFKSVIGLDEDAITMADESFKNAWSNYYAHYDNGACIHADLKPCKYSAQNLRGLWIGSESHPYAVKPSATVLATQLGHSALSAADFQFACKAGSEILAMTLNSDIDGVLAAIGSDTAQGKPGDALELYSGCGSACFLLGPNKDCVVSCLGWYSMVTNTPDFWRTNGEKYPAHGNRFTGQEAYFKHIYEATEQVLGDLKLTVSDIDSVVFHQPNVKFPTVAAKHFGFTEQQYTVGLLSPYIGNCYAASCLLGLTSVLDTAKPNQTILVTSFGSGAGSDCFVFRTGPDFQVATGHKTTQSYIQNTIPVNYGQYLRMRDKIIL